MSNPSDPTETHQDAPPTGDPAEPAPASVLVAVLARLDELREARDAYPPILTVPEAVRLLGSAPWTAGGGLRSTV